jgi:hypothetical protein
VANKLDSMANISSISITLHTRQYLTRGIKRLNFLNQPTRMVVCGIKILAELVISGRYSFVYLFNDIICTLGTPLVRCNQNHNRVYDLKVISPLMCLKYKI